MSGDAVRGSTGSLRVASLTRRDHQRLAVLAREHAEALLDPTGALDTAARPELTLLAAELARGWLRRLVAADPAGA